MRCNFYRTTLDTNVEYAIAILSVSPSFTCFWYWRSCAARKSTVQCRTRFITRGMTNKPNKNSSGDEIANVNFYALRPEGTRIR